ncbi:hypothetical protein [Coprococcus comes]|uniref:hypothetical protein n=1 Tax=Coprococcus comes TaxID=410072 RepID=UPI00189A5ADF|nr:hypothetical protein [Coprococcus comes]
MIKAIIISLCMAVTLTACKPVENFKWNVREGMYRVQSGISDLFRTDEDKAKELSLTIMRYVLSEDKKGLKELLAPELREMEEIEEQLDTFFVLMGSRVTTFRSVVTDSKTENLTYIISDIKTTENKMYALTKRNSCNGN